MTNVKLENKCPKCGSHLILREGQYGEFLACPRFPDCRYTESLHGRSELNLYEPPPEFCDKCNHTGLLPFEKNGMIIANVYVDCECRQEEPEHYYTLKPEDFDFPCSGSWRNFYNQLGGLDDPGVIEVEVEYVSDS